MSVVESRRSKTVTIIRKLLVAIAMTGLFVMLGVFTSMGYQVRSISEVSFERHSAFGYADATFYCDMVFNPLLYPTYWTRGVGHVAGRFSFTYPAEDILQLGEFMKPEWPPTPEGRYQTYILYLVTANIMPNLVFVFFLASTIEVFGKRELYIVVLAEMVGFAVAGTFGMIIGLLVGVALAYLLMSSRRAHSFFRWISQDSDVPNEGISIVNTHKGKALSLDDKSGRA